MFPMPKFPHSLRFRQVHLDFHTSGHIPEVGAKFDKAQFQDALRRGHVDSITVFAKCHHGYSYHPTKVGTMHPTLTRNLLGDQIETCREIGVRCPIYISAGLDEVSAHAHPEWLVVDKNGVSFNPLSPGFKRMSFDSPYLDFLCKQIEEVVQIWPDNDGIFLDIIAPRRNYAAAALSAMSSAGVDPEDDAQVDAWAQQVLLNYYERTTTAVKSANPSTPVFHNGGHIPVGATDFNLFNSHFELESLPTGGWGYDHFPISARYAITQPRDFLGMTGKFHNTWGEFGGFKRPAALQYECAAMISYGAKCSVGDQLHPSGEMNTDTYDLIGAAYAEVEVKEPWVGGVEPSAWIGVVSTETSQKAWRGHAVTVLADEGASRMLMELHQPFLVLDEDADWSGFKLIMLPDGFVMDEASHSKAKKFLSQGGKILAAGTALLNADESAFLLDPGAKLLGRSPFDPDYLIATELTPDVQVRSAIVIEKGAYEIEPTTAKPLVGRRVPYFNRTWDKFCSHQHTPDSTDSASPAAVIGSQIAYFAHNIFSHYRLRGQPLYRDFVLAAIKHLLDGQLQIETNLPTVARLNVMDQPSDRRSIVHLLYAPITLRAMFPLWGQARPVEIIEELLPLIQTTVKVQIGHSVAKVRLVPGDIEIPFTESGGVTSFTVPKFTGHQMVELSWF